MFNLNKFSASAFLSAMVLGLAACSGDNLEGVQQVSATGSGSLQDGNVTVVASRDDYDVAASVSIPKGTQLFDADGNLLSGDTIVVTIQAFDGTPVAESFFDGGVEFVDAPITAALGQVFNKNLDANKPIIVDLLGFVRVNATVGGVAVKGFSQPISVVLRLRDVSQGRTVAAFSVDEETIDREFVGGTVVGTNGNVQFTVDHLTAFGIAADARVSNKPVPTATPTPTPSATPGTGGTGATGSTGSTGAGGN